MSDSTVCQRYRVSGRVQGVFYRAATEEQALRLGVTGWVRNCANGDVELVACGSAQQLDALERWLWQGPPAARVTTVEHSDASPPDGDGFTIRY